MNIKWPKISHDKNGEAKGIVPTTEFIHSITIYWVSDAIVGRIYLKKKTQQKEDKFAALWSLTLMKFLWNTLSQEALYMLEPAWDHPI